MFFNEEVYKAPMSEKFQIKKPMAFLSGNDIFGNTINRVPLNDMHLLVLGATGMGKTDQIFQLFFQFILGFLIELVCNILVVGCSFYYYTQKKTAVSLFSRLQSFFGDFFYSPFFYPPPEKSFTEYIV